MTVPVTARQAEGQAAAHAATDAAGPKKRFADFSLMNGMKCDGYSLFYSRCQGKTGTVSVLQAPAVTDPEWIFFHV